MLDLLGAFFIVVFGVLGHFAYDWSNHKKIFAVLSAVNESVWEHIKLALIPSFIWILIEIPFIGNNKNFIFAKCISLLIIIIFIPLFHYSYVYFYKKHNVIYSIFIFLLSICISQFISYYILNNFDVSSLTNYLSLIIIVLIFSFTLVLTVFPFKNELFKDPNNNKYGLEAHEENNFIKK